MHGVCSLPTNGRCVRVRHSYASLGLGAIVDRDALVCQNETAAVAVLDALPCTMSPLCGFDSWQTACFRLQVSEASRAINTFSVAFSVHLLFMWAVLTMYSEGRIRKRSSEDRRSRQEDDERSNALERQTSRDGEDKGLGGGDDGLRGGADDGSDEDDDASQYLIKKHPATKGSRVYHDYTHLFKPYAHAPHTPPRTHGLQTLMATRTLGTPHLWPFLRVARVLHL